jgi:transposase
MSQCFVGIDVSKETLDIALRPSAQRWTEANDAAGAERLAKRLKAASPELVVLEATGGYEILIATALAAAGLQVAVVNPRQVRDFAKAANILAKTASTRPCWPCSATECDQSRAL